MSPSGGNGGCAVGTPIPCPGDAAGLQAGGVSHSPIAWGCLVGVFPPPPSSQGTPHTCGFFLGRPRPLFSDVSFSPLEARAWLDLAADSLIVLPAVVRRSGRERKVGQRWLATPAGATAPQPSPQ